MNQPQPFEDEDVLYRFTPCEEEREQNWFAHEYAVVKNASGHAGLTVYYSTGKEWRNDSWAQFSIVIARLLRERRARVTFAERDCYRDALEQLTDEKIWAERAGEYHWRWCERVREAFTFAVVALQHGKKIRGET